MNTLTNVNIVSREFKADPYHFYAWMRAEAPVFQTMLPGKRPVWLIARYDDVNAALKDERFAKDKRNAMSPEEAAKLPNVPAPFKAMESNMLDLDAPDHTRLRGLIHKAFTPRMIEQMRERIQIVTDDLLNAVERRGELDLIRDLALPLPVTVIADILGIPADDRSKFHRWSKSLISLSAASNNLALLWGVPSLYLFMRYIRRQIQNRRDNPQDDLITALVQAEEAGDKMNEDELVGMVAILLIAGHETTVNLIGNGVLSLLQYPEQLDKLKQNPVLIKTAVEELLRYASPVETATERYAREDIPIAGVTIPKGAMTLAAIASANRDEKQFPNPDVLDITRDPNKHLAFGQGIHYCAGAPLARMEGQIAINTLLARMPNLRMKVPTENLRWRPAMALRGLESLPLKF